MNVVVDEVILITNRHLLETLLLFLPHLNRFLLSNVRHTSRLLLELWVDVFQVPLEGFALELPTEFQPPSYTGDAGNTHTHTHSVKDFYLWV